MLLKQMARLVVKLLAVDCAGVAVAADCAAGEDGAVVADHANFVAVHLSADVVVGCIAAVEAVAAKVDDADLP